MAKKRAIVIDNFQKGIARSSYLGFEEIRCLNIEDRPGAVYPNFASEEDTNGTMTVLMDSIIDYGSGALATGLNKVFKRVSDDTWEELLLHGTSTINNSFEWKGYAALIYDGTVNWYKTSDDSFYNPMASNALTSGGSKVTVHAVDDALYIASGNVLDKIDEITGTTFDPSVAPGATYTVDKAVVDLPDNEYIVSISEIGNNLIICGDKKIYKWNKSTISSFDLPIILNKSINTSIAYNGRVYVQAGARGDWYVTNGTTIQLFSKLPDTMLELGGTGQVSVSSPIVQDDKIVFAVTAVSTANTPMGIYSMDASTGAINVERLISTNLDGSTNNIQIGAIAEADFEILSSWEQNGVYGIDRVKSTRYRNNEAYFISQFYNIGSNLRKKTFSEIQIELTRPIVSNFDEVSIYYRTEQGGAWTLIKKFDTIGQQSLYTPFGVGNITNIQFKVTLNDSVELLSVTAV